MERLLGNAALKASLGSAFRADRISHSYLISGPAGSGKHTLAAILAAAMQCTAGEQRPCGVCLQCRKVFDNVHPDVITVDDPEKKTVPVDLIRRARSDLYILPNEGRRKVYVIPRANDMNANAQNALLKVMEEPPSYGAFLLLSDNPEKLLPTIRSRCVSLRLSPLSAAEAIPALRAAFPDRSLEAVRTAWERAGGFYGPAADALRDTQTVSPQSLRFADCFARRDRLGLTELIASMERYKREQLQPVLTDWIELLADAIRVRAGLPGSSDAAGQLGRSRTVRELLEAVRRIQEALELLQGNVGVGAICGGLLIWLNV
ncbi:MAG: DNA polymerase III subunit delta [Oscillospiraceae bacterium]|nr:DNA polymerase III subunit delta [Oscillospiraceae bacterium]